MRNRITRALDLSERRQKRRRHDARGILLKRGLILAPSLRRALVERILDRKEQFRRLANDLIDPIDRQRDSGRQQQAQNDLQRSRGTVEEPPPAAAHGFARPQARELETPSLLAPSTCCFPLTTGYGPDAPSSKRLPADRTRTALRT